MSRRFLLTGATGVVGLSMIELLSPNDEIVILVNQRSFKELPVGVSRQIKGDIRKEKFGLNTEQVNELKGIECIVHSAALTDFTADPQVLAEINVAGLKHAIDLSEQLNVPLIHISTAFVKGRNGHDFNNYEHSKREAEACLGDNITVIRPSVIIGDSVAGLMPKKQGIHNMLKLATKEVIPIVPGDASTLVDVIPRDIVAKCILTIVDQKLSGEFWLTAGELAKTLGDLLTLGEDEELKSLYQVSFKAPKLMSPTTFERLVKPVFMPALPKRFKRMFDETSIYLKYLDMSEGFQSDIGHLAEVAGESYDYDIRHTLAKNLAAYDHQHPLIAALDEVN
ncbi:SDR family oxidoreductase [Pseudoalteromonas sp. SMS1]|uniref:SDR family oxidoreductase n=1 Tax=Pseudoalteromonas sp. SMS1 TaxID=2908894 RepID=UPI001F3A9C4B|nr:SDR family oxidoreductase [Pseudoalteromonas sp. SMS1]MCF2856172.1 SDR family oxidoreductase [Pseudoalteromonas sp. SMS1]